MTQPWHVALVGLNYMPHRGSGDKNFWVDLVPRLTSGLGRLSIISIRDEVTQEHQTTSGRCVVTTRFLSPRILSSPTTAFSARSLPFRSKVFPATVGIIEKFMNARRIVAQLLAIHETAPLDHIHLMDNFGLTNRIIAQQAARIGVSVSVSAMSYMDRNPVIYHSYLRASYRHKNITVIPYSCALESKLASLGIKRTQLRRIPWGVQPACSPPLANASASRGQTPSPPARPQILWAGYLQQIQGTDFMFALDCAKKALREGLSANFYFAFKPECYESSFSKYHEPDKGLFVQPTTVDEFSRLVSTTDIFFSPVLSKRSILAPPLTWIEVLSQGIPILTTSPKGAEEIISDGCTGYMARDRAELLSLLSSLCERCAEMRANCVAKVSTDYNIETIAQAYLQAWGRRSDNGL